MFKKLLLLCISNLCFFMSVYAQGFFSVSPYLNDPKGAGSGSLFGWGENLDRTIDVRPVQHPTYGTMMINYHTGLTFSAHSYYGGIRFYNQGYPNAYDPSTGSVLAMSVNNGNVGVGTANPRAALDVGRMSNSGTLTSVLGRIAEGDGTGDGTYLGIKVYTTELTAANNFKEAKSFAIEHSFYGTTNSSINFFRGGDVTGGNISFNTSNNVEKMRIQDNGNVGIGTTDTKGYKLAVAGNMVAEQVTVKLQASWPDYVFKKDYSLMPLSELKTYISKND